MHTFDAIGKRPRFTENLDGAADWRAVEARPGEHDRWFAATLDTVDDAVLGVDAGERVLFLNPAAERLTGWDHEAAVGRSVGEVLRVVGESTGRPSESAARQALRERRAVAPAGHVALIARGGDVRPIEQAATPVLRDPDVAIGAVLVFRDVSERRRIEERLALADRMSSVGTMAAGIAHEINNPLSYLSGNIGFVSEELRAMDRELESAVSATGDRGALRRRMEEVRQAIDEARQGADRARRIVSDLKLFSRPDEKSRRPLDVRAVVEGALKMTTNETRHHARVVKQLGPAPPVEANEVRLEQVFVNLLMNAAQAIAEGRAHENEIRVTSGVDAAGRVMVEVRDTGCGIPPVDLARVFEPFFTTKAVGVGTGLGLSICRSIVAELGGEIAIESTVGAGTAIRVALPASSQSATFPGGDPPPAEPPRRARILAIDDEPMVLGALRRALSRHHDITLAQSAQAALAEIDAGVRYDVILCDLMMPEMTGMDLHEELGRRAPDQADRVVFLTGGAFTPRARTFLEGMTHRRVEKPFDMKQIQTFVQDFLRPAPTP